MGYVKLNNKNPLETIGPAERGRKRPYDHDDVTWIVMGNTFS